MIDVEIREKERETVDIENCYCRQQMGYKFGLDKACRKMKKVNRGDVDISSMHCNKNLCSDYTVIDILFIKERLS